MHIVWMVVIGLIVGVLARVLIPARDPSSIVTALLLGVGGSIGAGLIGRTLGWFQGAWEARGFVASVVGAMLVILLYPIIRDMLRTRGG